MTLVWKEGEEKPLKKNKHLRPGAFFPNGRRRFVGKEEAKQMRMHEDIKKLRSREGREGNKPGYQLESDTNINQKKLKEFREQNFYGHGN